VLAAELAVSCAVDCCNRWLFGRGAENAVLEGKEGVVGVDGSSEVDGDDILGWERSSARTTSAGVPLGARSLNGVSGDVTAEPGLVVVVMRSLAVFDLPDSSSSGGARQASWSVGGCVDVE